jgi:hypothetical protein
MRSYERSPPPTAATDADQPWSALPAEASVLDEFDGDTMPEDPCPVG